MTRDYGYYKSIFANVPRPFAFVDLDMLDENARSIAEAAGDKRIRVASKSIRCTGVLRRILESDSVFQGVMCFTGPEAVYLANQGFDNLLLGYPICGPDATAELVRLIGEGRTITLMVDSMEHVVQLERVAKKEGVRVPVCLDIDMSSTYPGLRFGVWRSPVASWAQARPVVEQIAQSPWVYLDGVMGYEAQIAGVGDHAPGHSLQNALIRRLKRSSLREVAKRRAEVLAGIRQMGLSLRFVNAGGTGSIATSRLEEGVTEITAGSGFYAPGLFDNYTSFHYQPAAGYAVEVVRRPRADIVTCAGGGYPASGAVGKDKLPKPYLPENLELFPREGAGEVQTPLRVRGTVVPEIGDPVFFRHAKAGELCERFAKLYAVANGRIVGEYLTYRGAGECFL